MTQNVELQLTISSILDTATTYKHDADSRVLNTQTNFPEKGSK